MILNRFTSVYAAFMLKGRMNTEVSWDELITELSQHHNVTKKEHCPLFNLWEFDPNGTPGNAGGVGTVGRNKENALFWHGVVADVDNTLSIDEAMEKYKEFEFFVYTTFTHTKEKNKFRMVFPFNKKIPYLEYRKREESMSQFFLGMDKCTLRASHSFYFYSSKVDHFTLHNKGKFLDPLLFKEVVEEVIPYTPPATYTPTTDFYKAKMIENLLECSGVRYADGLLVASLCKSAELTFADFDSLCHNISATDSHLRDSKVRIMVWNDCEYSAITAATRDKFLTEHGATPSFKQSKEDRRASRIEEFKRRLL